jgi:Flp pilus assembly pilin Flp
VGIAGRQIPGSAELRHKIRRTLKLLASYVRGPKKGTAPSPQQGIAQKRLQADDLTVRTLLDWHPEDGQTFAEYSIILAVITPAIVLVISLLSDRIAAMFSGLPGLIP